MSEPGSRVKSRRWLRFGLRTLLVLLTVGCVWLAIVFNQCRRQRRAVEAIENAGGLVGFDYQFDAGKKDVPSPGPPWLRTIVGDELFRTPVHVEIRGEGINDAFLSEHLPGVRSAKYLHVESDEITDVGLASIAPLAAVEMLAVESTRISDAELIAIGEMHQLRVLALNSPLITDAGAAHLVNLKQLQALTLDNARLSPTSIRSLKGLDQLAFIHSVQNPANEAQLASLRRLIDVDFTDVPLIDALEFLSLSGELQLDVTAIPQDLRLRPVTLVAKGQPRRECLEKLLNATDLDYHFDRGTLKITTLEIAAPHRAGERACRETFPKAERIEVDW
jgi:hypothetical protein